MATPLRRTTTATLLALALALGSVETASAAPTAAVSAIPAAAAAAPAVAVAELDLAGVDRPSLAQLPAVAPAPAEDLAGASDVAGPLAGPAARGAVAQDPGTPPAPAVLTAELDVAPFSVMGVTWDPTAADVVIRYRVRQAGVWSDWDAVGASDIAPDAAGKDAAGHRGATDAIVALAADGLQVWAEADKGTVSGLKVVLVDPGHSPRDSELVAAPVASTSAGVATTGGARGTALATTVTGLLTAPAAAPPIIRRSQWGADESLRTCEPDLAGATLAAAVHHTASTNNYTAADVPGLLRGFLAYHTRPEAAGGRGWCDIGYNFLVDKFGRIFEGRAGSIERAVIGVHTGGFNSRTLGVAAIGEYGAVAPTPELLEGLSQVIAWKFATHRILANSVVTMISGGGASKYPEGTAVTFNTIYGHRDAQLTSCPGQNLYNSLQAIRDRVAALSNAAVAVSPTGNVEVLRSTVSDITVGGWVLDPDTTDPISVKVLVDDSPTVVLADQDRPDLAAYFPGAGTRHGFSVRIPAAPGLRAVCIWAQNVAGGNDLLMGCQWMTLASKAPIGSVDLVTATATDLTVTGWALDPDTTDPIAVHIYVDGAAIRGVSANLPRPDVGAAYGKGDNHGYSETLPATPGVHTVCVYGIDANGGANPQLGCRSVTVASASVNNAPLGALENATTATGQITATGWALDPDTTDPIQVHLYLDGRAVVGLYATTTRTDIGATYGKGDNHGYSATLPATPGTHTLCAYAIDSTLTGPNPQIGCRSVTVPAAAANRAPFGSLDTATATTTTITVAGWALDPDTSNPIQVHVYLDGRAIVGLIANTTRTDVGAAYGQGDNHGYNATLPATPGTHTLCTYAIDSTLTGPNPQIGCRTLTVTNRAPFGAIDVASGGAQSITVAGWALDPDTTGPIQVHVYVDGIARVGVTADVTRTDVGAAFRLGDNHGYAVAVPVSSGAHSVCVYAIDASLAGPNPQLGCRTVVVG